MSTQAKCQVQLLDLGAPHEPIRGEVLAEATRISEAQRFIIGKGIAALERENAKHCGLRPTISCASGSDAHCLALLGCGVVPAIR